MPMQHSVNLGYFVGFAWKQTDWVYLKRNEVLWTLEISEWKSFAAEYFDYQRFFCHLLQQNLMLNLHLKWCYLKNLRKKRKIGWMFVRLNAMRKQKQQRKEQEKRRQ